MSTKEERDKILNQLQAFRLENFREQRWLLIDLARQKGLLMDEIAEALDMKTPSLSRLYNSHKPKAGNATHGPDDPRTPEN